MDPNETLRRIRELANVEPGDYPHEPQAFALAELVNSLDEWLTGHGSLPDDWAGNIGVTTGRRYKPNQPRAAVDVVDPVTFVDTDSLAASREVDIDSGGAPGLPLDGFVANYLPSGLGSPSDFEYDWEDVTFHSRVWETTPQPDDGGTLVDLTVKTIRGDQLTDLGELRAFLTEYHEERDTWSLAPVKVGAYDGYQADGRVFYFVSPGVAAEVSIDRSRFSEADLLRIAAGFHPEEGI